MTDAITRIRYKTGDKVPPWLLDSEPMVVGAVPSLLTFAVPVDVVEMPEYYAVIPITTGAQPSPINFEGKGCKIVAPSKEVRAALSQAIVVCETGQALVPRRQTFWQKLKNLFQP